MTGGVYTLEEVAKHNVKESGWFIIHNNVYDVSKFYDDHPGGRDVLLNQIGGDATEVFEEVHHSDGAKKILEEHRIGSIEGAAAPGCMRFSEFEEKQKARAKATATACWLVIANKVYDLTQFIDLHPGGRDVLLCEAGTDATEAFEKIGHSNAAHRMMKSYHVADLHPDDRRPILKHTKEEAARAADAKVEKAKTYFKPDMSLHDCIMAQMQLVVIILGAIVAIWYAATCL